MVINDVSDTALWVATYRAFETKRPDALFRDPLAERLSGERGRKIAKAMTGSPYTHWAVVIRTCIIDSYLKRLITEGVDTIINLGAGLDTRPYRLGFPPTLRWIEVDYPHMIKFKEEKLLGEKPNCRLERVGLDLANAVARREFFSQVGSQTKRAVIITEGVTPYLSNEQVADLAADLRNQPHFSYWILDYFSPQVLKYMKTKKRQKQMQNAPFIFHPKEWFLFFKERGWKVQEIRYLAEESEKLGRVMPMPWWAKILRFIFRGPQRDAYRKFIGYVLLEPS